MLLTGLFVYPVKSLRGCAVDRAEVDELGLAGDRRFLVVDGTGSFLTQRALPRMARIATSLGSGALVLSAEGSGAVSVPRLGGAAAERRVSIWSDPGLRAEDCGDEPALWLGDFLGVACRLVRIGPAFSRPIPARKIPPGLSGRPDPQHRVGFADGYPFLVVGDASLGDLNRRLSAAGEAPVPIDRFRPNLVVSGGGAFEEDRWKRLRIGPVTFHSAGPCARCAITTTDQGSGERGQEPLRTLASYRRNPDKPGDVNFGQNLIHETKSGMLRVGDPVEILG